MALRDNIEVKDYELIQVSCLVSKIKISDVVLKTKSHNIVFCRYVAYMLLKQNTMLSNERIGMLFGFSERSVKDGIHKINIEIELNKTFGRKSKLLTLFTKTKTELNKFKKWKLKNGSFLT